MPKNKMDDEWIERILRTLEGLEYGSVHITVHDSQITQIERLEKQRFEVEKNSTNKGRYSQARYEKS